MRIVKLYDQYGFDKEKNHAAIEKTLDQHGQKKVFQASKILEPRSYAKAFKCLNWQKWLIAIDKKPSALIVNETWEYCKRPVRKNIITSKCVFKVKYTHNNLIDWYKAQLVAQRFTQIFGVYYKKTFAPTL